MGKKFCVCDLTWERGSWFPWLLWERDNRQAVRRKLDGSSSEVVHYPLVQSAQHVKAPYLVVSFYEPPTVVIREIWSTYSKEGWRPVNCDSCQLWLLLTEFWLILSVCFITTTLPLSYPWGPGGSLSVRSPALLFFFLGELVNAPSLPCCGISKPWEAWGRQEKVFVRHRGLGSHLEVLW